MLILSNKAKGRAEVDDDDAGSVDSMAMELDEPGSDFGSDTGLSRKKVGTSRGKKAAPPTKAGKTTSSRGEKAMVSRTSRSASEVRLTQVEAESDDEEMDEVPKSTTRTKRAAAPRFVFDISRLLPSTVKNI